MKKRLLSLLFAGAMMASMMAGCGGGGDAKPSADAGADTDKPAQSADAGDAQKDTAGGKYKIGMCMARRDQFQTTIEMNAKARAQELGVDLVVFDANDDITMQLTQIQTCVNDKYDGIITACIFVFVPIIGEFLTPTLVGGAQGQLIGNLVVNFFKGAQITQGAAFAIVIAAFVTVVLVIFRRYLQVEDVVTRG